MIIISKPKLKALILVILAISLYSIPQLFASPSPSISRIITPGEIGTCTWWLYIDGTIPVARAMIQGLSVSVGDNVVGSAGQDFGAFVNSIIITSYQKYCFSLGTFFYSTPILPQNGDVFVGQGKGNSAGTVLDCSGNCFQWNGAGGYFHMEFADFNAQDDAGGGGHIFAFNGAGIWYSQFHDLQLKCTTVGKSCILATGGSIIDSNNFYDILATSSASQNVPMVNLVTTASINHNVFGPRFDLYSGASNSAPAFRLENQNIGSWSVDNVFQEMLGDIVPGGFIWLYGTLNNRIMNSGTVDTIAAAPMIFLSQTIGKQTLDTIITGFWSTSGSASFPDIKVNSTCSCWGLQIYMPSVNNIDLGNTQRALLVYDRSINTAVANIGPGTIVIKDGIFPLTANCKTNGGSSTISTSSTTWVSTGVFCSITSIQTGYLNVEYSVSVRANVTNLGISVGVWRTTGFVPSAGSAVNGTQLTTGMTRTVTTGYDMQISQVFLDTPGLGAFNYYLGWELHNAASLATMDPYATNSQKGVNLVVIELL